MRTALIYAPGVLPASQTFVADQARGLSSWSTSLVGRELVADGLPVEDLLVPEMRSGWTRHSDWRRAIARVTRRVPAVRAAVDRMEPDLIHAHFLTGGFDVWSTVRPLPCPLVVTVHGFDITMHGAPPRTLRPDRWLQGIYRARLVHRPIRFLAVSRFIRDQLIRHGAPPSQVTVLYTGVDTSVFVPPPEERDGRGTILFVGRLVRKKGVPDLLNAVAMLKHDGLSVSVEIIGDGPERRSIERMVERERLDVVLHGAQPRSVVVDAMHRASVLCAPSRTAPNGDSEGFGMVLAEAQATGLPVVASRCGGMVDAVADGRTGFLVPEARPTDLAAALERILTDEDTRAAFGREARPWVIEHFDLNTQKAALEAIYEEELARWA